MWDWTLNSAKPLESLAGLPRFAFQFVFRELGPFRFRFWWLTAVSVLSALSSFAGTYLLSELINRIAELNLEQIAWTYLPLVVGALVCTECLDYFTRRLGESFAQIFSDYSQMRAYSFLLNVRSPALYGVSKERMLVAIYKYFAHVQAFVGNWFWGTARRVTHFSIALIILAVQSWIVLGAALAYFAIFLALAFRLARKFSGLTRVFASESLTTGGVVGNLIMKVASVRRLGFEDFVLGRYTDRLRVNWQALDQMQQFHARRWFLQLNLYQIVYVGSLAYGVYEVKSGELAIGFLLLIRYAFERILDMLIFVIEYYVDLIRQREDAALVKAEFSLLEAGTVTTGERIRQELFSGLELKNVSIKLPSSKGKPFELFIPHFELKRGEWIGLSAENGTGKSTLLLALLNLIPLEGQYLLNSKPVGSERLAGQTMTLINSYEDFLYGGINENLLRGDINRRQELAKHLGIDRFAQDFSMKFGAPDVNFSMGQLQRLRLLRGLLEETDVYFFDEAFSAIDQETRAAVIHQVELRLAGKAAIFISHNPGELPFIKNWWTIIRDKGRFVLQPMELTSAMKPVLEF